MTVEPTGAAALAGCPYRWFRDEPDAPIGAETS